MTINATRQKLCRMGLLEHKYLSLGRLFSFSITPTLNSLPKYKAAGYMLVARLSVQKGTFHCDVNAPSYIYNYQKKRVLFRMSPSLSRSEINSKPSIPHSMLAVVLPER